MRSSSYAAASATDAVGPVTIAYSTASGAVFALGATVVTVTATDGHGNSATRTFTVTVRDTTPPVLTVPANVVAEATSPAGATVAYAAASATDAVGAVTITYSSLSGSGLPARDDRRHVTAFDTAGNRSVGTFTITVRDTTPPSLTLPANIVAEATSSAGAAVTFAATATDVAGGVTLTYSKPSGSTFALGVTTVTVTARDAAGNQSSGTFTVTVRDTIAPAITVSSPAAGTTISAGQNVVFTYTATDAVGVISSSATLDGATIANGATIDTSKLTVGVHSIVVRASDAAGHLSTVTVTFTVAAPVVTIENLFLAVVQGVFAGKIDLVVALPLTVKLTAASVAEARGRTVEAAGDVQAFINQVKAQRGKKIDAAYADKLIAMANAVIAGLLRPAV